MPAQRAIERISQYILADGFHLEPNIYESRGVWIRDAASGKQYLDCYGNFSSCAVGHNHPKIEQDFKFRRKLAYAAMENPANSDVYTSEYADFVETFAELANPDGYFKYWFFIAGGGPAVDNALKTAFDWKAKKNPAGIDNRDLQIICFNKAFHGRTGYALSATDTYDPIKTDDFPRFNWPRFNNPCLRFPLNFQEIRRVEAEEDKTIKRIEKTIKTRPYQIAALIIEPIQGEGGDNHFRGRFLRELRRLTLEYNVLLIFDEVQTGFGTTGKMWCYEHFGVKPDILVFGKKSQICGIMVSDRIDEVKNNVFKVSGRINSTWGGNLVDMVKCQKILEIMKEEQLVQNADRTGYYFLAQLYSLALSSAGLISNVRGRGFFIAFDLPTSEMRDKFKELLWQEGLAHLKCGEKSIRFRPPLIFNNNHADIAVEMVYRAVKKLLL